MAFKCLAILALTTAVAHAAVVAPQQQAASQQFAYLLPQQPAQGYQQAYYYTPVALGPASSDVSVVGGQQQQQQQRQQVAFRAGETQAAQSASARLFLDFTSQITAINTAVQQLLNKGADPILVRADLFRSGDAAGANPVGRALLYQKSSTSNIQMFITIQYVGTAAADEITPGAAGDWNTVRIRQASTLGGAATRCNVVTAPTLGADVATITMAATANARPVPAAADNLNAIIGTASVAPATATLFGTNSIINKNLRIAGSANLAIDNINTFCGIINTVVV